MTIQNAAPDKPGLSLRTIWGVLGAIAGVAATIFSAGVYYQSLTTKLNDYVGKIDANERAIQSLTTELAAVKNSIAAAGALLSNLAHGQVAVAQPNGTLCPPGSYVQGIHALSASGGEHGMVYQVDVECRKFPGP